MLELCWTCMGASMIGHHSKILSYKDWPQETESARVCQLHTHTKNGKMKHFINLMKISKTTTICIPMRSNGNNAIQKCTEITDYRRSTEWNRQSTEWLLGKILYINNNDNHYNVPLLVTLCRWCFKVNSCLCYIFNDLLNTSML